MANKIVVVDSTVTAAVVSWEIGGLIALRDQMSPGSWQRLVLGMLTSSPPFGVLLVHLENGGRLLFVLAVPAVERPSVRVSDMRVMWRREGG